MGKIIYLGGYKVNLQIRENTAVDFAKWFLQNNLTINSDDKQGNLKLQKLLYYAQGMHLAVVGTPLYAQKIQAWENGPVVREVYDQYRYNNLGVIARREKPVDVSELQESVLNVVNIVYGGRSAEELVALTHQEEPWKEKIELVKTRANPEITVERMREYYTCLKEVFDAFSDYDVIEHQYRTGSNVFTFQEGTILSAEDKKSIDDFAYDCVGQSFFVSKDNEGRLVIY